MSNVRLFEGRCVHSTIDRLSNELSRTQSHGRFDCSMCGDLLVHGQFQQCNANHRWIEVSRRLHSHFHPVSFRIEAFRPLWLTITDEIPGFKFLTDAFNSNEKTPQYCDAVSRALDIPTCKVVPFFGTFLKDLRTILSSVPSIAVLCNRNTQKPIEVKPNDILTSDASIEAIFVAGSDRFPESRTFLDP
jgi:hypothetical protein